MARRTFRDLANQEVRSVLSVTEDQAYSWLLDRARVLNAETSWLFCTETLDAPIDVDGRYYELPDDLIWLEAVIVGELPYQRSTLHALDARWTGDTGNTAGIYAQGSRQFYSEGGAPGLLQIHPPSASEVTIRLVEDVEDDRNLVPPFPADFDQSLIDGACAIGMARMDERFDSAAYFDSRFASAVDRLRRRRHALAGRGATAIRIVQ